MGLFFQGRGYGHLRYDWYAVDIYKAALAIWVDCSAVVTVCYNTVRAGSIDDSIAYADLWQQIWDATQRQEGNRLNLQWMCAHTADKVGISQM